MLSSNTIDLLKRLNKDEFSRLGDFIRSPYLNSIGKLEDLYKILLKDYPFFRQEKLIDRKIFEKLYPGKNYTEKTIKNLYTEFGKILREFLIYEELNRDKYSKHLTLVNSFARIGAYSLSNKYIEEMMRSYSTNDVDEECLMNLYRLESQRYNNMLKKEKYNIQEIYDCYSSLTEKLVSFFYTELSILGFNIFFFEKAHNVQRNEKLSKFIRSLNREEFLSYLDSTGNRYSAIVKIYYLLMYHIVNEFTEKDLSQIKKLIISNKEICAKHNLLNFWANMTDLILLKLIPGNKKYYKDVFELAELFCSFNIYPDDSMERLPLSIFRNVVFAGMFLEKYEWSENFIKEYSNYLDEEKKDNEINYNMGILYFHYKNHRESLSLLSKIKATDIYENMNIRFYNLMNYIELKYYDSASSTLNAIKQFYITNKEIPDILSPLIKDSLVYFSEIIKCLKTRSKPDTAIYKRASGPGRFYMKKYVLKKMSDILSGIQKLRIEN